MTSFPLRESPKPTSNLIKINCPCGKEFEVRKCDYRQGKRKYCSDICKYKYVVPPKRAPKVLKRVTCEQCQKEIEVEKMNWNRKKSHQYCSNECQRKAKAKPVMCVCRQCSTEFITNPSKNKKFCNRKCWSDWSKENPNYSIISGTDNSGDKNGQYKHGKYVGKGSAGGDRNKLKVRKQVIEHDGNWCFICGTPPPGLHLHRVVYGSQGGKYEVDNCVQLCFIHHQEVHTSKTKWFPILDAHIKQRHQLERTSP